MRNQNVAEENLTVSSSSVIKIDYFDLIPVDLTINHIFSRLSVKSMGKCRCVSKLWSSILRHPNQDQLFPIISLDPPRLLFTFLAGKKLLYFSSPQPQYPYGNDQNLIATFHHAKPLTDYHYLCPPIHGLICNQNIKGNKTVAVISNPITGQSLTTPKLTTGGKVDTKSYFGYDPIEKQFKVLFLLRRTYKKRYLQHQVLTLETGNGNLLWRKIPCCIPYSVLSNDDGICINGVLYYKATGNFNERMIVCFDVRYEKFDFIPARNFSTLINYKGKLGVIDNSDHNNLVLWALEDSKEHKWSKRIYRYKIPHDWKWVTLSYSYSVGANGTWGIRFHPIYEVDDRFYIFYHNLESGVMGIVRVEVPGFDVRRCNIYIFPNFVEDVKLM